MTKLTVKVKTLYNPVKQINLLIQQICGQKLKGKQKNKLMNIEDIYIQK